MPLRAKASKGLNVLITCGPTWVAIDQVRVISNISSGEMGHLVAAAFKKIGAKVTVIEGPVTHALALKGIKILKYNYFDQLQGLLHKECQKKYDVIIHAAAVSDFKPTVTAAGKLNSTKKVALSLAPLPKLINDIRKKAPNSCLVGFKLETNLNQRKAVDLSKKLIIEAGCDIVLVNSVDNGYQAYLLDADQRILAQSTNKKTMADNLARILS